MKLARLLTLSLIGLTVAEVLPGATPAEPKHRFGVMAGDISEIRNTSANGQCWVYLNLTGDAVADAYSVHRVRVSVAQDELGRDLVKPVETTSGVTLQPGWVVPSAAEEQRRLEAVAAEVARRRALREATTGAAPSAGPMTSASRPPRPAIMLRNPSRQAATIRLIEGEIDLFTPTEANGGIVRLADLAAHPGEPAKSAALEAQQVQVVYFTREAFEANSQLVPSAAKVNYATAFGWFGGTAVGILVRDPKRIVVDLELQGGEGKPIAASPVVGASSEWSRGLFAKAPLPADAQLVVRVATPGAIQRYPFKLENVPLP